MCGLLLDPNSDKLKKMESEQWMFKDIKDLIFRSDNVTVGQLFKKRIIILKRYMLKYPLMTGMCFKIIPCGAGGRGTNETRSAESGNLAKLGNGTQDLVQCSLILDVWKLIARPRKSTLLLIIKGLLQFILILHGDFEAYFLC